jgi:ABC-type lipoprotein release transport system permease subunit
VDLLTLHRRSITYHWRSHLAVVLGVIVGTATLTGALLVGDSVRGSLRAAALGGLGGADYAVRSPRYVRQDLADELTRAPGFGQSFARICPLILERGSARHASTHASVHRISILGVDRRFQELASAADRLELDVAGRTAVLNQVLADELRACPGDEILLRVGRPQAMSPETLLGRRDEQTVALRLTVGQVIPTHGLGAFSLRASPTLPRNAYVPLATLQEALGQPNRVNALLAVGAGQCRGDRRDRRAALQMLVQQHAALADLGLRLRADEQRGYVAVESDAFLLAPPVEAAARAAAEAISCSASAVLSYLANTMAVEERPDTVIPYSTVAAIDPAPELLALMTLTAGSSSQSPGINAGARIDRAAASQDPVAGPLPGEIILNEWAAGDLGARVGDRVWLSYYILGPPSQLQTQTAGFGLSGVVRLSGAAADPGLIPEYPGVTDADRLSDWDPPFPIDLRLVRNQDEAYWHAYRTTPKAFISLADGQRLWASQHERFGRLTSLLVHGRPEAQDEARAAFEREFRERLDVATLGLVVDDVRARALAASRGSTDFAGLFIGFSLFLIVAAALLVALLFRLGVERRCQEIGLLLATGFRPARIMRLLLAEGTLLAAVGAGVGLLAAGGYAWLMLAGLRSWWAEAARTPLLELHATLGSYLIGYVASVAVAGVSIAGSLWGIVRRPPRVLLAGPGGMATRSVAMMTAAPRAVGKARPGPRLVALAGFVLGSALVLLSLLTDTISPTIGFFGGGTAMLIAGLALLAGWLSAEPHGLLRASQGAGVVRLGLRNARRHPGRSLLTAGLIAAASFVIAALQAMRLGGPADVGARDCGTGGFALLAEADLPLLHDLNTPQGRSDLNLTEAAQQTLAGVTYVPFRLQAGDETSCLNPYQPVQPRLLGATDAMITRGGFGFSRVLAPSEAERRNPWIVLCRTLSDGAIPAIADEAAARWQLRLGLGDELAITDQRGQTARLRLVALLRGSVLQGELIVAESQFLRLFPSIVGYAFYVIDTPAGRAAQVEQTLERELADYGLAVTPTERRLAELFAVQNTYLSTFQTLGGLGLLLGTVGLAAILLRNVWERRSELALLRTLGFSRAVIGLSVLAENAVLLAAGLAIGLLSAAVVVTPQVVARATPIPWASLLLTFLAVLGTGLLAGVLALISALRAPLLPALRLE